MANVPQDDSFSSNPSVTTTGDNDTDNQSQLLGPNRRLKNPLGYFSSVTYQLTLYMVTADAFNAFVESGRKDINVFKDWQNSGAYIVAQSGGVDTSRDDRPPGLNLDYYIDDLRIVSKTNAKSTQTATNLVSMTFNIYEPYGFSFISKLAQAHETLKSKTKLPIGSGLGYNPTRQFFVLGIRYLGYDNAGNLVNKESDLGLNPGLENESNSLFENFFDIYITNIKFNIASNSMTVYNITAVPITTIVPYGYKYGRLSNGAEVIAYNVKEATENLMERLNKEERNLKDSNSVEIPNEYAVEFIGNESDIKFLRDGSFYIENNEKLKMNWPAALISRTNDSNEYLAVKAGPDSYRKKLVFSKDISIMQAVESTIKQSTYLVSAINQIYLSDKEMKNDELRKLSQVNTTPRIIKWYNLSAKVICKGWDIKRNDWVYKITYIIQPYDTPCIISPFVKNLSNYYGPHKRYDFYYTGQNSEILSYSHAINNQWLNAEAVVPKQDGKDDGSSVPNVPNKLTGSDRTGKVDIGLEAQNNFVNNLYDPKAWVNAKIQILGDPDFLIRENNSDINSLYKQYYGSDFTINANSGQVFIEIDFKEGVDYDNSRGLMNINEQLTFWRYPEEVKKYVKGVSYMVTQVDSNFSKGKFTQDLTCVINTTITVEGQKEIENKIREQEAREADRINDLVDEFGPQTTSGIYDKRVSTSINNSATNRNSTSDDTYTGVSSDLPSALISGGSDNDRAT